MQGTGTTVTPLNAEKGKGDIEHLRKKVRNQEREINELKLKLALAVEKCRGWDLHREIFHDNIEIERLRNGINRKSEEAFKIEQIIRNMTNEAVRIGQDQNPPPISP